MRKAILIFCLVILAISVSARVRVIPGGYGLSGCGDYSSCAIGCKLLEWDCASTDVSSDVCTVGADTSMQQDNESNITSGYLQLTDDSDNGDDSYRLSVTTYDVFPAGAFTLKMKIDLDVISSPGQIFRFYLDSNNYIFVYFSTASGNDIGISHKGNGNNVANIFDANLSVSTSYDLIITADGITGMDVSTDGGSSWIGVPGSSQITTMTHVGTCTNCLYVGNQSGTNMEGDIDDVEIYAGYKTNCP